MKVVIIEDEILTAENLAEILLGLPDNIKVIKLLQSVRESIAYFQDHPSPDLIFCDIQLGDGSSFEIFAETRLEVPVIFCTAFNTYAVDAFSNHGIDYILKPFSKKTIGGAIEKFKKLNSRFGSPQIDYKELLKNMPGQPGAEKKAGSLLVTWKDKIIPVKIDDIALFTIEYKMTQLVTHDNQKYYVSHTLEELEEICGDGFFRVNRQYLINRECISEALQHFPRKLLLLLKIEGKYEVVVGKNRIPEFLSWLKN
ncbi:MAG: LytTR family DNA-binding domain-containing protein [Chitinophagaceae bacterium]